MAPIKELADECKRHHLAGNHSEATRCMKEIHAARPGQRFIQSEDGEVRHLGKRDADGKRETKAIE